MDDNKLRFGVGVLVISAIGIGIILVFLFGAFPSVLKRDYSLSVVFPSAEGISVNTPVVRDGVRIGRVADIELRTEGGVLVMLSMDRSKPLTHEYLPQIKPDNFVTGDSKLEFVSATPQRLSAIHGDDNEIIDTAYSPGEFLDYGEKQPDLFEMQDDLQTTFKAIQNAGESIAAAGDSVNQLAIEVRQMAGGTDQKVTGVSDEALEALQEFKLAMQDIRAIVGNPEFKANLEQSLAKMPGLLDDAQQAVDSANQTIESFERVGNQFEQVGVAAEETMKSAQSTFENLEGFTAPLAERGGEMVSQLLQTLRSADVAMTQVGEFGKSLNSSDGTVKRLLEDKDIYWQIRRTIENIEQATAKVRPILDDVRVFSDKIARDPRELGVRGAISRRPSGAGLK
jgi:phospholipid/cholesterol/gamma-HCH transport system substrate-binding protein